MGLTPDAEIAMVRSTQGIGTEATTVFCLLRLRLAQAPHCLLMALKVVPWKSGAQRHPRKAMKPISNIKLLFYGFLTWLIPFAISIPLIGREGQPILPAGMFKSLMIVVGSAVGAWFLVRVFRHPPRIRQEGLVVGVLWLAINVGLDLITVVPLSKMSIYEYFSEIGLRYLVIPIMAIAIAAAAGGTKLDR
jgi:uncharacterized membrane protein YpjA